MAPSVFEDIIPGVTEAQHPPGRIGRSEFFPYLLMTVIFVSPLVAYWSTIFHYYGLRDSYSNLREAHEEPGKLIQFCASHARPIYGWLLEVTLRRIDSIQQLQWIRMISSIMLGAVSLLVFRLFISLRWPVGMSALFALWLGLIPSAQVIAGWAIGWPYSLATLVSIWAFLLSEKTISEDARTWIGLSRLAASLALLVIGALIYQPNVLFYVVPMAAALVVDRGTDVRSSVRWALCHALNLSAGLLFAFAAIQITYLTGTFHRSARVAFEDNWGEKLDWFLKAPIPNALSLFVINDDHHYDREAFLAGALIAGLICCFGTYVEWRKRGWMRSLLWLAALVCLPIFAFAINLLAAERYATYRTIFALTGVLLCFLLASLRSALSPVRPGIKRIGGVILIAAAMLISHRRAYALLAVPQGNEWRLVLNGAEKVRLEEGRPRIFIIEPTPDAISTRTVYHDEFGSLSSNSDWVPKEMFKRAMHDLHPDVQHLDKRYIFSSGPQLPSGKQFDLIIDMRELRNLRTSS